jgi:hypothetical protein
MPKEIMFSVPLYKYKVKDWDIKKKKLLDLFGSFQHKLVGNVITSPINITTNILDDEIKLFEDESRFKFTLSEVWFQKYEKTMDHVVHTHGPYGFSSVCFVNYEKNSHSSTTFISPFSDCITGGFKRYSPNVNEGDIIFFPANLLHYAPTNLSDEERIIIAFNLDLDNDKKTNNKIKYQ